MLDKLLLRQKQKTYHKSKEECLQRRWGAEEVNSYGRNGYTTAGLIQAGEQEVIAEQEG